MDRCRVNSSYNWIDYSPMGRYTRLNSQLKPALIFILDENPSNSSVGFQVACAYASETINKFAKTDVLLTEHNQTNWSHSHTLTNRKINLIDLFDDHHSTKSIEECLKISDEKGLIIIESLPWLLLRISEGNLTRLLHTWSQTNTVIAVIPLDCLEESSFLKNLIAISYITVRVKTLSKFEMIEARIEQRSRINVDTIKSCLTFSIDAQFDVINLHEEKISNRKLKSTTNTDGSSKTDVTANLTFNLRLKDDEVTAKNNLVLPYTKQHTQTSDDGCTIHYSYDKEDDIDEDEDEDLNLFTLQMTEQTIAKNPIRSDLVDTAVSFLKNHRVAGETIEKKREFLLKKGLTDTEIEYAFKIIPQKETSQALVPAHRPSFLRRIISDVVFAGLIAFAYQIFQRWFRSKQGSKTDALTETIKALERTVQSMQTSIAKLEQTADQLHLTMTATTTNRTALDEIKRDIQVLKELSLGRTQFPSIPQVAPRIPSWQLEIAQKSKSRSSVDNNAKATTDENKDDGDSIILVSENEKKSDDENQLSLSPTSDSSNDA